MGFIEEQIQKNIANRIAIEKAMGKEFTESDCLDLLEKAGKAAQMGEVRTWNGKEYIKTPKGWRRKPKGYKEGANKESDSEGKFEKLGTMTVTGNKIAILKDGDRYQAKVGSETLDSKQGESISDFKERVRARWGGRKVDATERTEAGNPVGKPESVTSKKVTDKFEVGDRVMYRGKLMELTRISKDGRFQNGIEMKFVNEGDSTPTGSKTLQGNMMYTKPVKEKGSKSLAEKKNKIAQMIKELNNANDELEELDSLMFDDDYDDDDEQEAELEYGGEYEEVDARFNKIATKVKSAIKNFMKDADPNIKIPKGAEVWDLVEMFEKVKF